MNSNEIPVGTVWVCIDCMLLAETGEAPDGIRDREPWGAWAGGNTSAGVVAQEHSDSCTFNQAEGMHECNAGCEVEEFSHRACPTCGSTLAGARYAYTEWSYA